MSKRTLILLWLLGVAVIFGTALISRQRAAVPRPAPVTDDRPPYGRPLELADKDVSPPPGLVGKDVIVVVDAKTGKVTAIHELPKVGDDGTQTVELPAGVRFLGVSWRYRQSLPQAYWPPEDRYEVALMPRDPKDKPRTYTITIKEH